MSHPALRVTPLAIVLTLASVSASFADDIDALANRAEMTTKTLEAARAMFDEAEEKLATATKELSVLEGQLARLPKSLEADEKALAAETKKKEPDEKVVAELSERIDVAKKSRTELPGRIESAKKSVEAVREKHATAKEAFERATAEDVAARRAHEGALIEAGQLVSFAKSVAPILNDRCVACHNARTAKGRLNLATFTALVKGGESGSVVDVDSQEFSNLLIQVEDGSMPKDADPLTAEQIAVVKKWLETGARLDAGIDADAPLVTIMPKPEYPAPPETYRVPIPVTALAFSPDGSLLATSGYHEVLLYDAATGELRRRIPNVAQRVHDLAFTSDGRQIAVAAGTPARIGEARLFDVATGEVVRDFTTTTDDVFAVSFSPDGKRLATAGADRAIRIHDVATGETEVTIEDHADWVLDVAWSPDGSRLVSASRDKTAKVFDTATGDSVATFNGHGQPVYSAGVSPDGKQGVTAGGDRKVHVWNLANGKKGREIGGFGGDVFRAIVTGDGHVFTASSDKTARQHGLDGKAFRTFSGHADWVYAVAHDPTGSRVATAGYDGEVRVWNVKDGSAVVTFTAAPGYTKPE